jgi:crotonobetainyl-CoA hydratase
MFPIKTDRAQFGLPEVKRGIYAATGRAFRIAQQLPIKVAMEILLTGEPFLPNARLNWALQTGWFRSKS